MIVRERSESLILVAQHDHATLSGQLAEHWKEAIFWNRAHTADVLLAIYQHDRGWINLDESPAWDQQNNKAYTFIGYPLEEKLLHYRLGIDEVEAMNPYAAILCSMHYSSFMNANNKLEKDFIEYEDSRQVKLKKQVYIDNPEKEKLLTYHFYILQFFDDLSLYLCINQPGVSKEDEFPFFRNGFKNTQFFTFTDGKKIEAYWKNKHTVAVSPFPLIKELEIALPYKEISKGEIEQYGLAEMYKEAPFKSYMLTIAK